MAQSQFVFQSEVVASAIIAEQNAKKDTSHDNHNMLDEVMEHSKKSWSHVKAGHSTLSEKAEVGAEAAVATVATAAALFAMSKCLPEIEHVFPEASSSLEKNNWITPAEAWKDLY